MTFLVFDIETQGLNAQAFLMGCVVHQNGKAVHFSSPEKMLRHITAEGYRERQRGKKLLCYAHNLHYDFIGIGAHRDIRNVVYSHRPFIADHTDPQTDEQIFKWVDSHGLWNGTLASMGEAVGEPKGRTPTWLLTTEPQEPSFQEQAEARQYMEQDCRVLLRFLHELRGHLWADGVRPRQLLTAGQVAMSHFRSKAKQLLPVTEERTEPETGRRVGQNGLFSNHQMGELWPCRYLEQVREGYRGARVQAFQSGRFARVAMADVNSLYPAVAARMRFPDLRTETLTYGPRIGHWQRTLLPRIGMSRVLVTTPQEEVLGLLGVRTTGETVLYPDGGERRALLGTWTHEELTEAIRSGYTVHSVSWSLTWEEMENPFRTLMPVLYKRRQGSEGFANAFTKLLMNSLLGKFAQRRETVRHAFVTAEELPRYTELGWEAVHSSGETVLMAQRLGEERKRFTAPILSALVTGGARVAMHRLYRKVPRQGLLYTDTDNIVWDMRYSGIETFKYSTGLGGLKLEATEEDCLIYGAKAYRIGDGIRLNRVPRAAVTKEGFDLGLVEYRDMLGVTAGEAAGRFVLRSRELHEAQPPVPGTVLIDTAGTPSEQELAALKRLWQASKTS